MNTIGIPGGFKPYRIDNTFNDVIAPIYLKIDNGQPVLGMPIQKHHCNYGEFAHGGCLMTLLDIALSGAVCNALGLYTATPTVSFNVDFMAPAHIGDWIQVNILAVDLKNTLGFVSASIDGPHGRVAHASGCFKLPGEKSRHAGLAADEYHRWRQSPS